MYAAVLFGPISLFVTIGIIKKFAGPSVSWYVYLLCFFSWIFSALLVVLVPADVVNTWHRRCVRDAEEDGGSEDDCKPVGIDIVEKRMDNVVSLCYWGTVLLASGFIPILQSYAESGDFTVKTKFKAALKENALIYGLLGIVGAVFLVWIAVEQGLGTEELKGVVSAMSTAGGLLAVICLLGYGVVQLPRSLWDNSDPLRALRYCEFRALPLKQEVESSAKRLGAVVEEVRKLVNLFASGDDRYQALQVIVSKIPEDYDMTSNASLETKGNAKRALETDMKKLAALHCKVMAAVDLRRRAQCEWELLLQHAFRLQDLQDVLEESLHFVMKRDANVTDTLKDTLQRMWYGWLHKYVLRMLAVLSGVISFVIVASEVTLFLPDKDISLVSLISKSESLDTFTQEMTILIPMTYVAICCYFSLFRIKVFELYNLVPGFSSMTSLCFNALLVARLTPALCFNFLTLLDEGGKSKSYNSDEIQTSLSGQMGDIQAVPIIGKKFHMYFPLFLIFVILVTFLNVTERVLSFFRVARFTFQDNTVTEERISLGAKLLDKERDRRSRRQSITSRRRASSSLQPTLQDSVEFQDALREAGVETSESRINVEEVRLVDGSPSSTSGVDADAADEPASQTHTPAEPKWKGFGNKLRQAMTLGGSGSPAEASLEMSPMAPRSNQASDRDDVDFRVNPAASPQTPALASPSESPRLSSRVESSSTPDAVPAKAVKKNSMVSRWTNKMRETAGDDDDEWFRDMMDEVDQLNKGGSVGGNAGPEPLSADDIVIPGLDDDDGGGADGESSGLGKWTPKWMKRK
eukprot:Rmarinus@m.9424